MAKTSAAKRLNTFVDTLIRLPVKPDSTVGTAFAGALKIDSGDKLALTEAYAGFLHLIQAAINEVDARYGPPSDDPDVEETRGIRMAPLTRLYNNFAQNSIHSKIEIITGNIDARLLDGLAHVSATVQEVAQEEKVEESELLEVLSKIAAVKESVSTSDFAPSLKFLILGLLSDIEKAIAQYQLSGVAGIGSAVERMVGALAIRTNLLRKVGSKGFKVLKDVWFVVTVVTNLINAASHTDQVELPPALTEIILPSIGPASNIHQIPADPTAILGGAALPEPPVLRIGDHTAKKE